jgi:hypothetical protein
MFNDTDIMRDCPDEAFKEAGWDFEEYFNSMELQTDPTVPEDTTHCEVI